VAVLATWMSFASIIRELRRCPLTMLDTHIVMSSLIFCLILILVFCLALLMLCLIFLKDITIAHVVFIHQRIAWCPDTLVTAHVLIVVIISQLGPIFLLEGLSPTFKRNTWMVHIFPIVVLIPLVQRLRCKRQWRLPQVACLSARFLRFTSLTPALCHWPLIVRCKSWTEDWRTCSWWTLVALNTWSESLNGSPTSLPCFLCVWFLWEFSLWLFSVLDSLSGHSFSHSLNTCEPNMRFCLIDGFLDSFSCRLGWVHGHASRASFLHPQLYSSDAFIGSSHVVPLRASHHFFNNHTHSFPRVNISRQASKVESETSFSNQILHLANPHDKLCIFVLYPCLGFPSIYRLTLWDPRLRQLSLLSYVWRRIRDGEYEH
jgi:hypothetical protein